MAWRGCVRQSNGALITAGFVSSIGDEAVIGRFTVAASSKTRFILVTANAPPCGTSPSHCYPRELTSSTLDIVREAMRQPIQTQRDFADPAAHPRDVDGGGIRIAHPVIGDGNAAELKTFVAAPGPKENATAPRSMDPSEAAKWRRPHRPAQKRL